MKKQKKAMHDIVDVCGVEYEISEIDDLVEFFGLCFETGEIHVQQGLKTSKKRSVLFHELCHAVEFERRVFSGMRLDTEERERIVEHIASGMLQVIKSNPKFFKEQFGWATSKTT